jgi:hypothetical protein
VSPPPARPNPLGELLSLVDVEATFTGISLPWTPEAPRTGVAALDQDRSEMVPDRPGRRAWDTGWERGKALWSEGRRQSHETWNGARRG